MSEKPPEDVSKEDLWNRLRRLEKEVFPDRRDILKTGAGIASLGAAGMLGRASADPGDSGETTWGAPDNRDSWYANEIDSDSVSTDEELINGPLPSDPVLGDDAPIDVVSNDQNNVIRMWSPEEGPNGRRTAIQGVRSDGQRIGSLLFDSVDYELSLGMNAEPAGSGADSASGAVDKVLNIFAGPVTDRDVFWKNFARYVISPNDGLTSLLIREQEPGQARIQLQTDASDTDDVKITLGKRAVTQTNIYRDGSRGGNLRIQNGGSDVLEYQSSQDRLELNAPNTRFVPKSSAPPSPSNGDVAYADGAGWDPGSGAGLYCYEEGSWIKL